MTSRWLDTRLGDVLTLQRGFDLPAGDRRPGRFPVVASTGVVGTHSEPMVKGPGVVIGRSGSLGGAQYINGDFWPLNTTLWVKDFKGNDRRFCYYLLKSLNLQMFNVGSGVPTLNRNHVHPLPVRIPVDVNEQRSIVHVLGALDDKIELNRQMNDTLEAMARALFKSWFIDFDPVRAKAEDRDPGLPANVAALFPDSFEDSELGKIPKGWEVRPFSDIVHIIGGGTPTTTIPEYWGGDIPWFSVVDAPRASDVWAIDTEKKITQAGVKMSSTRILPVGSTIISARGTVGRLALVGVPMAMNQSCYGLQGKTEGSSLFTYCSTRRLVAALQQRAHGSVFDTITRDTLAGVPIPVPPANVVQAFEFRVSPILEQLRVTLFKSQTLAALRDALLPKLLSGEIRVGQVSSPGKLSDTC